MTLRVLLLLATLAGCERFPMPMNGFVQNAVLEVRL